MTVRTLSALALAAGLCAAQSVQASDPDQPTSAQAQSPTSQANQHLADSIATRLRTTGVAAGADVRISTQKGIVQLSGHVQNARQREEIVRVVLGVPGVNSVQHTLDGNNNVVPAQAVAPTEPAPLVIPTPGGPTAGPMPVPGATLPPGGVPTTDPVPLAPPTTPAYDPHGPQMPPYSWPTYAPYNNFSRVAYPQAYPYNAWPYIGPFYPFPKVPLGWRGVTLTWEDGHWYYGRVATPHDYWRVRTW